MLILATALSGALDDDGLVGQILCALGRDDDQCLATVGFLAAVEQVQRLGDPARVLMVLERDRTLVEPSSRVVGGMLARHHCNSSEVLTRRTVLVHVAAGEHGDPLSGSRQSLRSHPRICRAIRGAVHGAIVLP